MRKNNGRKGFTLIELMIVIAIIIILAAVAIPNYLNMTDRAKRSRVASDFNTVATALETYSTDWGHYPAAADWQALIGELSGGAVGTTPTENITGHPTITGEDGGIVYIKPDTLTAMKNPWTNEDYGYSYDAATGKWTLSCDSEKTDIGVLIRTSDSPNLTKQEEAPPPEP